MLFGSCRPMPCLAKAGQISRSKLAVAIVDGRRLVLESARDTRWPQQQRQQQQHGRGFGAEWSCGSFLSTATRPSRWPWSARSRRGAVLSVITQLAPKRDEKALMHAGRDWLPERGLRSASCSASAEGCAAASIADRAGPGLGLLPGLADAVVVD